jgi:hypothetical protein
MAWKNNCWSGVDVGFSNFDFLLKDLVDINQKGMEGESKANKTPP